MSSEPATAEFPRMAGIARRGALSLEAPGFEALAGFVRRQQNADGGFKDRSGASDLYYTHFGVECLAALGLPIPAGPVSRYLDTVPAVPSPDLVHRVCRLRIGMRLPGAGPSFADLRPGLDALDDFRVPGGGYRLDPRAPHDSVYAGFLAGVTLWEAGREVPDPGGALRGVDRLRALDGGYAEAPGLASGTTPVTAAAAILLRKFRGDAGKDVVHWLLARQSPLGGFLAGPRAPFPDLLSTATALLSLRFAGGWAEVRADAHRAWVESLFSDDGGFGGHLLDDVADCEYTWYGLLCLGLLNGGVS